ncbi:hypothetical protein PybrP1_007249 [[Pythium] brassicae (nom. inval.)]|nr:hypothetical protein PybrP1_007249 [[Pythium] brassicae (nom. inval.)]
MASYFELATGDFFGATAGAGSEVKWMMTKGIGLQREWCLAHLLNAATEFAFGIEAKATTKNIDMTQLVEDLRRTVRIVRDVSTMGSLFESLCQLEAMDKAVRLANFQAHRFLGLTKLVQSVLDK